MIQDWDLFLVFTFLDGATAGKDWSKLTWFLEEVNRRKSLRVKAAWLDFLQPTNSSS